MRYILPVSQRAWLLQSARVAVNALPRLEKIEAREDIA
jgi:hypothetical protein